MKRGSVLNAALFATVLGFGVLPSFTSAAEPICYTQRTVPDNAVLPRPHYASLLLPAIHLPDAAKRRDPVSLLLQVTISETGSVATVAVAEPSVVPDWDKGVLVTARDWSFVPGTVDGEPTPMCIKFRVTATLDENKDAN